MTNTRSVEHAWSGMRVTVEPDPLGPVNKVVTLWNAGVRVRSVLCPVSKDSTVTLGSNPGNWLSNAMGPSWREMMGEPRVERKFVPPHYYVDIDEKRIITVDERDTWGTWPKIEKSLRRRFDKWRREIPARIMKRFGYIPDHECENDF